MNWLARILGREPDAPSEPGPTHLDLSDEQRSLIAALYDGCGVPADSLPYTPEFDALFDKFVDETGVELSRHYFWRAICGLRKAGRLKPRKPAEPI